MGAGYQATAQLRAGPRGILALLGASALWGTTGTAQAIVSTGATPAVLGAGRLALGGSALLLICVLLGRARKVLAALAAPTRIWVGVGAIAAAAFQPLFFSSVDRTGVAVGTLVALASAPVFCGLLAGMLTGERPGSRWVIATVFATCGCGLLLLPGGDASVDALGVAMALLAGACYGAYTVSAKRLLERGCDPLAVIASTLGLAGLLLAPLLISGGSSIASVEFVAVVAWLGLVATAVAYMLFVRGLNRASAVTAGTLSLAEPLIATLLGMFILSERASLTAGLGGALLIVGLALAALGPPTMRSSRTRTAAIGPAEAS